MAWSYASSKHSLRVNWAALGYSLVSSTETTNGSAVYATLSLVKHLVLRYGDLGCCH